MSTFSLESSTHLWTVCESYYFLRNSRIRCVETRKQYRIAIANFSAALGHEATVADLSDDNVSLLMLWCRSKRLATRTANERRGRINCLWRWLAARGHVRLFPTIQADPEPRRMPLAWSRDELRQLLRGCDGLRGKVGDVPASLWWRSLHFALWDSGERISALLSARWCDLSGEWLTIQAESRKGKRQDMLYRLAPDTLAAIEKIQQPARELVWPWPLNQTYLWTRYKNIRKRAGLSTDRRSSFHRLRRSVATHAQAAGLDASELLGHATPAVTRKSYLDPRFSQQQRPADVLFRPGEGLPPLPG